MAEVAYWDRAFSPKGTYDAEVDLATNDRWPLTPDVLAALGPLLRRPGVRVLDAGCGGGKWGFYLAERFPEARIMGIDFSSAVAGAEARRLRDPGRWPRLAFLRADVGNLPFRDGAFDVILSLGVLGHLEDPRPAARETARLLAPGGLCFSDVVNRTRLYRWHRRWDPLGEFERNDTPRELAKRFADAGLVPAEAYAKDPAFMIFTSLKPPARLRATCPALHRAWWQAAVALHRLLSLLPGISGRSGSGFYAVAVSRKPEGRQREAPSLPGAQIPELAAVLITRNEERNLPHCLAALQGRVGEIVVLDSASTDRTREIAAAAGARVFVQPFLDFASQKNRAAELATRRWVLNLDADETLEAAAWPHLKGLFREGLPRRHAAFAFPRKTIDRDGRFHLWVKHYPAFQDRLYDRTRCRWVGTVHERLMIRGRRGIIPHHMHHRAHHFSLSSREVEQKMSLYAALLERGGRRAPRAPLPLRVSRRLSQVGLELGAMVLRMHLERQGPASALFLLRWTAVALCPPLRRLTWKRKWDERMTAAAREAERRAGAGQETSA